MAAPPPAKKMRWDRLIMAILLLAGVGAGIYLLANR
jgi:hypothetical protein